MPKPERVYCDFENNFPNFYLYNGIPKEKKANDESLGTPEGIRKKCGELGLEPAEIKNESAFLKITKYLKDSGSSSEDDYGIPIAYKYESEEFAPYRSFNDRESDVCLDAFKKHVKESIISSDPANADAYVLVDEYEKVKKVILKEQKLRGVVCSPNEEAPNPSEKSEIKINCNDDVNIVNTAVGSTLAFLCPKGCKEIAKFKVFAGNKANHFSEHSSICRSAIF